MNCERVATAVSEAKRFLDRVAELNRKYPLYVKREELNYPASKEGAAVLRASLYLSAALAAMRSSQ